MLKFSEAKYETGESVKVTCTINHAKVFGVFIKEGQTDFTYMIRFPDGRTLYCEENELNKEK